jgi:hypothetical protein
MVFHGVFGTTAQDRGLDQTVLAERGDVVAVLARNAADFSNREVDRGWAGR